MRTILFAIIVLCPLARAVGQRDTLSECEKKYQAWKAPKDYFGEIEMLPQIVRNDAPMYPDSARSLGKEGTVWIWCVVDTNGMPTCVRVIKGAGYGFDEAAVEAMKNWRFIPAGYEYGKKYESSMTVPFKFKLSMKNEESEHSDENH